MALQTIIFSLLIAVVSVLIILSCFLLWYFYRTNKKIDVLLEKGNIKDLKDILLSQKEKHDGLEEKVKDAFKRIKNLDDVCRITIQKVGIIRYNPFNDIGGNQSFVIAMLDQKNNGFVISSLFSKEGNRVYTKAIKNEKSEHSLSKEEKEAIDKAIKGSLD